MTAYYNEIDPFAAAWLRNLIHAGHIAPGDVDERSIVDVRPDDLKGYTQAHFFAGIGGWSLAARLAGWPDDKPLWTGSCPCQPFSAAGKRKGTADERHLWPVFAALIRECRPPVVAGEQVASKDGLGWLDGVCADLEAADYAWWAGDYCAAGVGAPHIRQRLWWLADANGRNAGAERQQPGGQYGQQPQDRGAGDGVGPTDQQGPQGRYGRRDGADQRPVGAAGVVDGLEHAARDGREQRRPEPSGRGVAGGCGEGDGVADAERHAAEQGRVADEPREGDAAPGAGPHAQLGRRGVLGGEWLADTCGEPGQQIAGSASRHEEAHGRAGRVELEPHGHNRHSGHGKDRSFWSRYELVPCRDGTARRVEPGVFPLAHGVSGRVGKLRAFGNAIVPQVAAEILKAYLEGPDAPDPFS